MGFGGAKQQVPSPWGEKQFKHEGQEVGQTRCVPYHEARLHPPCHVPGKVGWANPQVPVVDCAQYHTRWGGGG